MADNVIGIKFGVAGGSSLSGESGKLIKEQLDSLAGKINLKVNINKGYFKSQLSSLKKELDKTLGELNINIRANVKPNGSGGGSSEVNTAKQQEVTYESVRKTLEKLYQTRVRLLKLSDAEKNGTVNGTLLTQKAHDLENSYEAQLSKLKELLGVDDKRVKEAEKLREELEKAYSVQQKTSAEPKMATPTDLAKLGVRAQSLYTDNGFDKIIARNKEAADLVNRINAEIQEAINQDGGITKTRVSELNTELLNTQARLKEIGRETDTVGNKVKEAFDSRVVQRMAQMLLLFLIRSLKQVYQNVKEIDSAMTDLQIVTNATAKQMDQAAKNISKAAQEIGTGISDLISSTTVYARLGYDLNDAQKLAEKTTIYAKVAGVNVNEATTNITGIIKAFNIGADGLEAVLDQLIYVGNKFPISQAEIGEAMNNAASSLAANGNSLQESIGIVSAANTTLQNVSKSSTAVRTIAARISASTSELEELGESIDDVETFPNLARKMRAYGIEITDANGQLLSTYDVLEKVADQWDNLEQNEKAAIATMLAGTRQQAAFYSIMQNWGDAQAIVAQSGDAAGALMDAQEIRLDSIEGKLEQLKATWESLSQSFLNSDIVKFFIDIVEWVGKALDSVMGFGDGAVPKIALIIAAIAALSAIIPKLYTLIDLAKVKLHLLKMEAQNTGSVFIYLANTIKTAMVEFIKQNGPMLIMTALLSVMTLFEGKAKGFAEVIVASVMLIAAGITIAVKGIDATIKGFMASNPIGWILAAITLLVVAIKGVIDLFKSFNPSFDDLKEAAKECKDAWEETKEELDEVKKKINEVQEAIDELNSKEKLSIVDQQDLARLQQELEILKQEEAVKGEETRSAQRDAMNSAEDALDKYKRDNTITDSNGVVIKSFDSRMSDALKNYYSSADKEWAQNTIKQYSELLDGFEYGMNEKLDSYFDEYYRFLDMFTTSTNGANAAWTSIISRVDNEEAVNALKEFADTYSDTSKITGDALRELAQQKPGVQKLFDYLQTIGMWDGDNWEDLTVLVGNMRTKLSELASVDIVDDIEAITDKFDSLNDALSDISKNGIISLETLSTLADKYPSLLNKYFNKTLDGYVISDAYSKYIKDIGGVYKKYSEMSDYEILQDMAISSLQEYQKALDDAKDTLAGLSKEDDDYEIALKNLAIAQDNLNTKEIEWASLLRESAIEDETERLQKMQDALEDQLDTYKDLIDLRKDLLKTYEEEVNYQRELAKKQKSVADLQVQLSLAKLDKSAAGQARARELESQLQEAQDELDEYTLERAIQDITAALDNEYSEYEKFIQGQVDRIEEQIGNIVTTLNGILSGIEGLSNTQFTGSEMFDLYSDLKSKQSSGMNLSNDAQEYMDLVGSGNYSEADKLYATVKSESDKYETPATEQKDLSDDEKLSKEMTLVPNAWGRGIAASKEGDNGIVTFNGKEYHVENGGNHPELGKAAYSPSSFDGGVGTFGDRDIFVYKNDLYGCLDGSVVKLRATDGWHNFWSGVGDSNNYNALKASIRAMGIYHTGGFVGDVTDLKSNEEFAKLLKGEFVATPEQIDIFMKKTLPWLIGNDGSAKIEYNSPLIEINCGSVTEESLPELNDIINKAVEKIKKDMSSALGRTGYRKQY